jgi:uncharacterized protein
MGKTLITSKKKTVLLLAFLSLAGVALSQTKPKKDAVTSKKPVKTVKQKENTLLWEVTGNQLTKPSYIFGTMHILCADDAKLSDNLKKVIKDSEQIYFEIDMDDMQQMMSSVQFLRMRDGKKISDLLTEAEYERVKKFFERNKSLIPFQMLNRFKPYFVSSVIGERMMACEKVNGMEQQIMEEAGKYEKDIKGLESIEFQASIFDSIPYEKQAKDLVTYVDSIDSYRKVLLEMIDVYRAQDLKKMEELVVKSDPGMTEYMDLLLYDRNRNWLDPMQSNMLEKSTLFAVGAGHLPGEQGILNLLKKQGYKVKPIEN